MLRRCQPALGTFVEVTIAAAASPAQAQAAVAAAYAEISRVTEALSFHDAGSELSLLNRHPVGEWMTISADLRRVLTFASRLQRRSGGVFNVAIGRPLADWGFLPMAAPGSRSPGRWTWDSLARPGFAVRGSRARRIAPIAIDLGGLAKGYAVDRAVAAIRRAGPGLAGCVNAGGDLRVFGRRSRVANLEIWIRGIAASGGGVAPLVGEVSLRGGALATSSVQPAPGAAPRRATHYLDIQARRALAVPRTASVRAPSCMAADALTKVALLLPARSARRIARAYRAELRAWA